METFLMQIIILWKIWHHQETLVSTAQVHVTISQWPCGVEMCGKSLSEFNGKYPESINCFSMHANLVSQPWKFW